MTVSPFKMLATMQTHMGRQVQLRLGPEDEIASVHIGTDKCWIILRVARISDRKNGYVVTDRGIRTILFKRVGPDGWNRSEMTAWGMLDAPEHRSTWPGRTPEEHAERQQWEDLCYRPGTPEFPMDNAARRAQGIK